MTSNSHSTATMCLSHTVFTRATLASAGISSRCVWLSVCLSQVGVVLKWLNVGSHAQCRMIAEAL